MSADEDAARRLADAINAWWAARGFDAACRPEWRPGHNGTPGCFELVSDLGPTGCPARRLSLARAAAAPVRRSLEGAGG
jgi:hypothetical protein